MANVTHRRRDDRPRWHGWASLAAAFATLTGVVLVVQVALAAYAVVEALRTGAADRPQHVGRDLAAGLLVAVVITAVVEQADKPAAYATVWSRAFRSACSSTKIGLSPRDAADDLTNKGLSRRCPSHAMTRSSPMLGAGMRSGATPVDPVEVVVTKF